MARELDNILSTVSLARANVIPKYINNWNWALKK